VKLFDKGWPDRRRVSRNTTRAGLGERHRRKVGYSRRSRARQRAAAETFHATFKPRTWRPPTEVQDAGPSQGAVRAAAKRAAKGPTSAPSSTSIWPEANGCQTSARRGREVARATSRVQPVKSPPTQGGAIGSRLRSQIRRAKTLEMNARWTTWSAAPARRGGWRHGKGFRDG